MKVAAEITAGVVAAAIIGGGLTLAVLAIAALWKAVRK